MPVDTNYQRALDLAKAGKLLEAQALLLTIDTPQAEKLLAKVNAAITARGASQVSDSKPEREKLPIARNSEKPKNGALSQEIAKGIKQAKDAEKQEKAKQQAYGCLILIGLLALCGLWYQVAIAPKPQENIEKMCKGVREIAFQCDPQIILSQYPDQVDYCQIAVGNWDNAYPYEWETCMEDRGVVFPPAN